MLAVTGPTGGSVVIAGLCDEDAGDRSEEGVAGEVGDHIDTGASGSTVWNGLGLVGDEV